MQPRSKSISGRAVCGLVAVALTGALLAGCGPRSGRTPGTTPDPPAPAAQPYDPVEMGKPGPQHESLARFAGVWKAQGRTWMEPGGEPLPIAGTMRQRMILGDRFLESEWEGSLAGTTKFWGRSLDGYDRVAGEYVALWVDSMGTLLHTYRGAPGPDANVRALRGTMPDPSGSGVTTVRNVTTYVSSQAYKFESWATPAGGEEFKAMEILFTRLGEADDARTGDR